MKKYKGDKSKAVTLPLFCLSRLVLFLACVVSRSQTARARMCSLVYCSLVAGGLSQSELMDITAINHSPMNKAITFLVSSGYLVLTGGKFQITLKGRSYLVSELRSLGAIGITRAGAVSSHRWSRKDEIAELIELIEIFTADIQ